MSSGESPLAGLIVIRRVLLAHLSNGEMGRGAYTPSKNDTDGLSFYDSALVAPIQLVNASGKPPEMLKVFRVPSSAFVELNVPLKPSPDTGPSPLPGHYLAPTLNYVDYQDAKADTVSTARRQAWLNMQNALVERSEFVWP
ncbi:MAG TPA: hypothetical protein VHY91_19305 [Pirellulales bacterium]|jgi:hypothetical protein|nr:hypothetical protein [Pirellulales bacterium]